MPFKYQSSMHIETHLIKNIKIAEITSDAIIVQSAEDGLDLLGNLYYQGFDKIIIHSRNISPDFFDLKNGMAGEILQKFSNYRIPLAIVGDFTPHSSKNVKDFIAESNKMGHINFVNTISEALKVLRD